MKEYTIPSFGIFINDLRSHFAKSLAETEHWEGVRQLLKILCTDKQMRKKSKEWVAKRGVELQLHHDPDYGFL